jgi:hypothetical protein
MEDMEYEVEHREVPKRPCRETGQTTENAA